MTAYGNYVFVGGTDPGNGTGFLLMSTDGGATWSDIVNGAATGPSTGVRSMEAYNLSGGATPTALDVATDAGVWTFDIASGTWTDITGNLADAQYLSASSSATSPNIALAAGHSVGITDYTVTAAGNQNWVQTTGGSVIGGANGTDSLGTEVQFDQANPALAYSLSNGTLRRSTNANTTNPVWTTIGNLVGSFQLDPNNAQRILITVGGALEESLNEGASFTLIGTSGSVVALADYQGQYQADPGFPSITANPSNTVDTSTIYVTNGSDISVTKNHRATTVSGRGPSSMNGAGINIGMSNDLVISDIIVDPADRDTVFAVTSGNIGSAGVGHVFESTNAGQTWTDITGGVGGLADVSAWTIAIDPRTNNLYVGTDTGVYELAGGVLTAANNWVRFGAGLPFVQVRDIQLNMTANVLTIATYGRGMYEFYLDDNQPQAALRRPERQRYLDRIGHPGRRHRLRRRRHAGIAERLLRRHPHHRRRRQR